MPYIFHYIHCVRKKETKMFFVISPKKRGQLRWDLIHGFPNKFATESYKRFPPRLNDVSTLPCETWNAHRAHATIELLDRKTPELSHLNCGLEISQIWIQFITVCGKYCKRGIRTTHAPLIWTYRRCHWRMAAAMTTWSSSVLSVLSRCFSSSRSMMRVLYTFSCSIPTHSNQPDSDLANLEATIEVW